ncbi:MAG: S9 family peptidase [Bacteroidales bacterium]|nr:S9 family peptidase [Bacteroidales bacterium]
MHIFLSILFFSFLISAFAQSKKPLDHSVYDKWETLGAFSIGASGNTVLFEQNPNRGDGMIILTLGTETADTFFRAASPSLAYDESWLAYQLQHPFDSIRQLKIKKTKDDDMPKDTAVIYIIGKGECARFFPLKKMEVPIENSIAAFILLDKVKEEKKEAKTDSIPQDSVPADTVKKPEKPEEKSKFKSKGTDFLIYRPNYKDTARFENITEFAVNENGNFALMLSNYNDSLDSCRIILYDVKKMEEIINVSMPGECKKPTMAHRTQLGTFFWSTDSSDTKAYSLMLVQNGKIQILVDTANNKLDSGFCASIFANPYFSYSDERLIFGIAEKPVQEPEDTVPSDEIAKVDVWSWTDLRLQPQQLKELKSDKEFTLSAVYNVDNKNFTVLGSKEMDKPGIGNEGDAAYVLGVESMKYNKETSWEVPGKADYYYINIETGERKLLLEAFNSSVNLSPNGKWIAYFNYDDSCWYSMNPLTLEKRNLTASINDIFYNDEHDTPTPAGSFWLAGWTEKDESVIINAKYDLWKIDPSGKKAPVNLTACMNAPKVQKRYIDTRKHLYHIPEKEEILLSLFNDESKDAGFAVYNLKKNAFLSKMSGPYRYSFISRAENSNDFLFRKMNYQEYAQLYRSDFSLKNAFQLSDANRQQSEYYWGTVKRVSYTSYNGDELEGLLYLPEKFTQGVKMPMIVYFYEKYSDAVHQYYTPGPSRSVISFPFYNSNGYAVFIPDIVYREGYPGQSAYDCIMAGVDQVLRQFPFIDSTHMGIQGQSWGGYQVAWLVTRTDRFAAAMAGAPVSNMTSAYGGIRWESGVVRQFQYENTQSRIGQNLWNAFDLYIENSPLFGVPNIHTPVLIMSNDGDGAVPWYQGIEYFTALRRLDKPAWLLNYNSDAHNLLKWPNRVDLSKRMFEFFEHYLKDKDMPEWMEFGRPALEK